MCEATVFLIDGGEEKQIIENVVSMRRVEDGQLLLASLLGEQRVLAAEIREVDLLHYRIVLEPSAR